MRTAAGRHYGIRCLLYTSYNYLLQAAKLVNGKETALLLDGKGTLMLRTGSELHVLMPTRMPQEEVEKPKRKKKAA